MSSKPENTMARPVGRGPKPPMGAVSMKGIDKATIKRLAGYLKPHKGKLIFSI